MSVALDVSGLGHRYGSGTALHDVSLDARPGELVCIVGPSGCGKSTLLRAVAGLLTPTSGEVRLDGEPVRGVVPGLAMVFQDYSRSLYPWLSVRGNVELPLRGRLDRAERRERAEEALKKNYPLVLQHHILIQN
jgi:NitT/TauT family transport system ATP-binding protein